MRLNLAASLRSRNGLLTKDAKVSNGLIEAGPDGSSVRKRPGLVSQGAVHPAGPAQMLTCWNGTKGIVDDCFFPLPSGGGGGGGGRLLTPFTPASIATGNTPRMICVSPDSLHAYCANEGSNTVTMYSISPTTGELIPLGTPTIATGTGPYGIAISADGAHVYVTNLNVNGVSPDTISQYSRNSTTGQLTALSPATVAVSQGCAEILVSADGLNVFAAGYTVAGVVRLSRSTVTGLLTYVGASSGTSNQIGIAMSPDGAYLYSTQGNILTPSSSGDVYQYSRSGSTITALTPSSVVPCNANGTPAATAMFSIAVALDGSVVFASAYTSVGTVSQYTRGGGGLLTPLAYTTALSNSSCVGLAQSADGTTLYTSNLGGGGGVSQQSVAPIADLTPSTVSGTGWGMAVTPNSMGLYTTGGDAFNLIYQWAMGSVTGCTELNPTLTGDIYSSQSNGNNAPLPYLMFKNSVQGWTLEDNTSAVPVLITDADYPGTYAVNITSLTRSGTVATATTAFDTNFQVGSTVVISGATPSAYNGSVVITAIVSSVGETSATIPLSITRVTTVATAVSTVPHGFVNGQTVTIAGAQQAAYNGAKVITWISASSFSYTVVETAGTAEAPITPATPVTGGLKVDYASSTGEFTIVLQSPAPTSTATSLSYGASFNYRYTAADSITIQDFGGNALTGTVTSVAAGSIVCNFGSVPTNVQQFFMYPVIPSVTSITRTGTVATVTLGSAYPFGPFVNASISGANQAQYNVTNKRITITGSTTFTYAVEIVQAIASTPATPATGTITAATTIAPVGASFTYAIAGSPASPATGTIIATGGRSTVLGIAYLDGYFIVMDVYGVIYTSSIDDPRTWSALDYTTAQAIPGAGVFLGRSQNYVAAFKEYSTEFFYNASNAVGSPLSPVDNGFTQIGCASDLTVASLGDKYFFVGQVANVCGRKVYKMAGTSQESISTPDVERVIELSTLVGAISMAAILDGHSLYFLTMPDIDVTLVYDIDGQVWTQWTTDDAGTEHYFYMAKSVCCGGDDLMLHKSNGILYEITPSAYTDAGDTINLFCRTDRIDAGTMEYKVMSPIRILGDKVSESADIRWSDDDCGTYITYREVDLSLPDPMVRRSKRFLRRTFEIRQLGNNAAILTRIDTTP